MPRFIFTSICLRTLAVVLGAVLFVPCGRADDKTARPVLEPFWKSPHERTLGYEDTIAPSPGALSPESGLQTASRQSGAVQEFLRIHNAARAEVGAPPLRWSPALARRAQQWAEHLAATGRLQHHPHGDIVPCGENLFGGAGHYGPSDAARAWLEERHA